METAFVIRHTRMLHLYIHPSVQIMSATLRKRNISQYVWTMLGPPASLLRKYRAAGKGQSRNYVVLPGWTPSRLPLSVPTSKRLPTQFPKKRKTVAHHKVRKKCCMERTAPLPPLPLFLRHRVLTSVFLGQTWPHSVTFSISLAVQQWILM